MGQKLNCKRNCHKRLFNPIAVVLCKKRLEKTINIKKMRPFWKLTKMATMQRLYSLSKIVSLGQKLKLSKICQKWFFNPIAVVLCKKRLEKAINIRKMRPFWKSTKMATMQRLYSICKIISLGQKLKFQTKCQKRLFNPSHLDVTLTSPWRHKKDYSFEGSNNSRKKVVFVYPVTFLEFFWLYTLNSGGTWTSTP